MCGSKRGIVNPFTYSHGKTFSVKRCSAWHVVEDSGQHSEVDEAFKQVITSQLLLFGEARHFALRANERHVTPFLQLHSTWAFSI